MDMWGRKIPVNWEKNSVEVDSHTFLFHSFDVLIFAGDEQVQQAVRGSAEGDPGEVEAGPGAAAAAEGSRRQEEGPAQGGAGAAAAEGAGAAPAAAAAEGGRGGQCGGGGRGGRRGGRRGEAGGGSAAARRFIQVRRFRAGKTFFPQQFSCSSSNRPGEVSGVYSNAISKAALTEYVSIFFSTYTLIPHRRRNIFFSREETRYIDSSRRAIDDHSKARVQNEKKISNRSNIIFNVQDLLTALKRKAEEDRKKGIKVDDGSEKQWVIFLQVGNDIAK